LITFQSPFAGILAVEGLKAALRAGLKCRLHGRTEPAAQSPHNFAASNKMIINISYDSSVASAPAAFKAAINYVVNYFDTLFTNPVTININVGWGEVNGQTLGSGALGESSSNLASTGGTSASVVAPQTYHKLSAW
jgi:hypothetical protein